MNQSSTSILNATPDGILLDGAPLAKDAVHKFPSSTLLYIKRANELLKYVKAEDWDNRTPHANDDFPILARVNMLLALASPQTMEKAGFNPDEPRGKDGKWTNESGTTAQTQDFYVKRKQNFVDAHLAATEDVAKQLNVPLENLLGIAALESKWGESRFASENNNFFGLHYPAPFGIENKYAVSAEAPYSKMAVFESYEDSLKSFISGNGNLIQGKSDPVAFMQSLQDSGKFGINPSTGEPVPTYVHDTAATIRGLRPVIAQARVKAGNK